MSGAAAAPVDSLTAEDVLWRRTWCGLRAGAAEVERLDRWMAAAATTDRS